MAGKKKQNNTQPPPERERRVIDPRTHDVACEVVPTKHIDAMTDREYNRFRALQRLTDVGIYILLSAIARSGDRVSALKGAMAQFGAEATTDKAKAVLVRIARILKVRPIELLESGDFEKPGEIAHRLLEVATAAGRDDVEKMREEMTKVQLEPRAAAHAVVAVELPEARTPKKVAAAVPKALRQPLVFWEKTAGLEPDPAHSVLERVKRIASALEGKASRNEMLGEFGSLGISLEEQPAPETPKQAAKPVRKDTVKAPKKPKVEAAPPNQPTEEEVHAKALALSGKSAEEFAASAPNVQLYWTRGAKQYLLAAASAPKKKPRATKVRDGADAHPTP